MHSLPAKIERRIKSIAMLLDSVTSTSLLWINALGSTGSHVQHSYGETNIYTGKYSCSWEAALWSQKSKAFGIRQSQFESWILTPSCYAHPSCYVHLKSLCHSQSLSSSFAKWGKGIYLAGLLWILNELMNMNDCYLSAFWVLCVWVCGPVVWCHLNRAGQEAMMDLSFPLCISLQAQDK
jgi:hypothetical protein